MVWKAMTKKAIVHTQFPFRNINGCLSSKMLIELADLAISIRKTGLTNPITVRQNGSCVSARKPGERRWLAYHLLNLYFPDEDWKRIPAHLVDEVSVWRQASENNARSDLNAIWPGATACDPVDGLVGRAWLRVFTLFDEILDAGGSERDYYAQVADGTEFSCARVARASDC